MKSFSRLILWPALAGVIVAVLFLYLYPDTLAPPSDTAGRPGIKSTMPNLDSRDSGMDPSIPGPSRFGPVSYADAVKRAAPAVVNVYTTKVVEETHPLMTDPFFRRFFGNRSLPKRQRMQSSLGSGVVISSDGYLLTNNHVIANADEIAVALRDGRASFATVVGTDPETDLAILKVDLVDLPVISLASSEQIEVGDVALAIGNPFGVGQTVTMGIISATGRHQLGLTTFEDFIQTDAAINPGNSGGALVNAYGELIGVNTAIFSKSGGSQGIGFAIPSDLASQIMQEIIRNGSVERGWLGVEVQPVTPALAQSFGLASTEGVLIAGINRGGPAHMAGIKPGDVMLQVDEQPVLDARQVMNQITQTKPGSSVEITLIRKGQQRVVKALVAKRVAQQIR